MITPRLRSWSIFGCVCDTGVSADCQSPRDVRRPSGAACTSWRCSTSFCCVLETARASWRRLAEPEPSTDVSVGRRTSGECGDSYLRGDVHMLSAKNSSICCFWHFWPLCMLTRGVSDECGGRMCVCPSFNYDAPIHNITAFQSSRPSAPTSPGFRNASRRWLHCHSFYAN